ncbi:hypothetical protein HDV62DRAFT_266008 [Trichoderma sp. SZMC 28011]
MQLSLPEWLSAYSIPGLPSVQLVGSRHHAQGSSKTPSTLKHSMGYEPYFRTTKRAEQRSASRSYVPFQARRLQTGTRTVYLYIPKSAVSWSALRRRPCLRPAHRSSSRPAQARHVRPIFGAREKATKFLFLFLLGPEENNGASPHTTAALKSPRTPGNSHFWPGTFRRRLFRALALSPNPGWNRAGTLWDWIMKLWDWIMKLWDWIMAPRIDVQPWPDATVPGVYFVCIGWDWIGVNGAPQSPAWRCSKSVSTKEATSLSLSLP